MKRKRHALFYVGYVLFWAVVIVAGATVIGAVAFPVAKKLVGDDRTFGELTLLGARYFAEWTAKVWALAIAIVMAVNHAYRQRQTSESGNPSSDPAPAGPPPPSRSS
jgi:hypothetical protein